MDASKGSQRQSNSGPQLAKGLTSKQAENRQDAFFLPRSVNDLDTRVKDGMTLVSQHTVPLDIPCRKLITKS